LIKRGKLLPEFALPRNAPALLLLCAALLLPLPSPAAVSVIDDANRGVTLTHPARRIVSLAPHATELIYAAGAGSYLVGVSEYSNYPPQAKRLPSVGGVSALDLERVVALKPDLVVVWGSGNSAAQIAKLRALGIPVFESEPRDFAAIASSIERLAQLAGTEAAGRAAAENFRARLEKIKTAYRQRPVVSVFYQIWRSPLMTLNGAHLVSAAIRLCGGENIFARLPQLAPTVGAEAVLKANPEAIIASGGAKDDPFAGWRRFPTLTAVARGNLFSLDGELMNRAAPRVLDGTEALCKLLETARSRR
jgi:iron complex transport system substrate-binding protein